MLKLRAPLTPAKQCLPRRDTWTGPKLEGGDNFGDICTIFSTLFRYRNGVLYAMSLHSGEKDTGVSCTGTGSSASAMAALSGARVVGGDTATEADAGISMISSAK